MSLEDTIKYLADALTANTDALHALAAAYRMQGGTAPKVQAVAEANEPAPGEAKRGPGRPRKVTETPPPSPEQAAASSATASTASTGATPAAAQAPKTTAAPSPAPTAAPTPSNEGTYADLQQLVPMLAAEQGRNAVIKVFASLGFENGRDLQAKAPEKVPEAVRLFRAALETKQ